jgi:glycerol-3-phosphate dehydrogenase
MEKAPVFDVVVIGGGISGLGVLLEASLNGFSACLLEKDGLCQATSANSLRIIHGGLRYLQQFDFARIRESLEAQAEVLEDFTGPVKSLTCLMPLSGKGTQHPLVARFGAFIYRTYVQLALKKAVNVQVLNAAEARQKASLLAAPHGALMWTDGLLQDPYEVFDAVCSKAVACGAKVFEHCTAERIRRLEPGFEITVRQGDNRVQIPAKTVVNATGPWLFQVGRDVRDAKLIPATQFCLGYNVIVKKSLPEPVALGVLSEEGRLFFAVPREQYTALGTGYTQHTSEANKLIVSDAEVEGFLEAFNAALPQLPCGMADVVKVEAGLLPVRMNTEGREELLGQGEIYAHDGFVDVLSTKYTTFRTQARQVISLIRPYIVEE